MPDVNLLLNSGFEDEWQNDHSALYCPDGGEPQVIELPNTLSPPFWRGWYRWATDGNQQPEWHDTAANPDPRRTRTGQRAMQQFASFKPWDGGFMQTVEVKSDTVYRLSAWAHGWARHDGDPGCNDDGCWSKPCGRAAGYMLLSDFRAGAPLPPETLPEATRDDWRSLLFLVGIDPTGGTDPLSSAVVWGDGAFVYNAYREVPPVEVTAMADHVTVYLRCRCLWPFRNNDAYWDDASLVAQEGPPPLRYYSRVTHLPPQDTTPEEYKIIAEVAYGLPEHPDLETITFSADDAFLNPEQVTDLEVHVWDPHRFPGGKDGIEEFADKYYPLLPSQTRTILYHYFTEPEPPGDDILLAQRDPRWANVRRIGANCTTTIGADGCWETCCAMAQRFYGIDPEATPVTVNEALGPGAFTIACEIAWVPMPEALGIRVLSSTSNTAAVDAHLDDWGTAFAEVTHGAGKHFVFVPEKREGKYWCYDPWTGRAGYLYDLYPAGAESWRLIAEEDDEPEPPEPGKVVPVAPHLQGMGFGWDTYIAAVKPLITKVLVSFEDVHGILRVNPTTMPVVRNPVTNDYGDVMNPALTPEQAARVWISKAEGALHQTANRVQADYPNKGWPLFRWESMNEMYASSNVETMQRVIDIETAMCDVLHEVEPRVGLCVYCAAVGNIEPYHYNRLVPLGLKAQQRGAWFGYHAYWLADRVAEDWKWLAGRWTEIDKVLVAGGARVGWYCGEGGCVGGEFVPATATVLADVQDRVMNMAERYPRQFLREGGGIQKPRLVIVPRYVETEDWQHRSLAAAATAQVDGYYQLLPNDGWKSPSGWGGDWRGHQGDIMEFGQLASASTPGREGRWNGLTLFTTGPDWTNWLDFQVREPEWTSLAVAYNS